MRAMICEAPGAGVTLERREIPQPGPGELRLRVCACGVCRTDLHVVDGDLPWRGRVAPGHEIVGVVEAVGPGVADVAPGERRGVAWLGGACGTCRFCRAGLENLCETPEFMGYSRDGGFADAVVARADYTFPLPAELSDNDAAPLLCAGVIGYRAWRKAQDLCAVEALGIYGFGAAAHLLAQLAISGGQRVHAFTRPGDLAAQALARDLGCVWAGGSETAPPEPLDAAILFAPVGGLVTEGLARVRKGGAVICAGIHMSPIPSFPYDLLWGERTIASVANVRRQDVIEYLPLAAQAGVRAHVTTYGLERANTALDDLREGRFVGAAVVTP